MASAIFHSKRTVMYKVMATRNSTNARSALLVISEPHEGLTCDTWTSSTCTPASSARTALTSSRSAAVPGSARTRSRWPWSSPSVWISASGSPTDARTSRASLTETSVGTTHEVPPSKSMPRLSPRVSNEARPTTMTTSEIVNHSFLRPTKSTVVCPW